MLEPKTYEEFWPYYVSQHLNAKCRWFHFAGTTLALGCVALSPAFPKALLAAPLCGYGLAWIGHLAFEGNKPASLHSLEHFAWSLRSDFRMYRYMLTGKMDGELVRR